MMSAAETAAELTDECRDNEEEREQIDEWFKKATAGTGSRLTLAPSLKTAPWAEGEHYVTDGTSVTLECSLPPNAPASSIVVWTWQREYVDNMRVAKIDKMENNTENIQDMKNIEDDSCTLATFLLPADGGDLESTDVPEGRPQRCPPERLHNINFSHATKRNGTQLDFLVRLTKVQLNQTATYQCSLIRTCNPGLGNSISVTKSLYLKVFTSPNYLSDIIIACSALAVSSVSLLLVGLVSMQAGKH